MRSTNDREVGHGTKTTLSLVVRNRSGGAKQGAPSNRESARRALPAGAGESAIQRGTRSSLLVAAPSGIDTLELATALAELGMTIVWARTASQAEALAHLPRYALLGASTKRDLAVVRKLSGPPNDALVVAVIGPDDADGPAYEAGAAIVLRRPISIPGACAALRRLRAEDERTRAASERSGRDLAHSLAGATASLASTIASEMEAAVAALRCELASGIGQVTALEQLERVTAQLRELAGCASLAVAPLNLRGALESAADAAWCALTAEHAPGEQPTTLPRGAVEIVGDRPVIGYANAPKLEQVLALLLEAALRIASIEGGAGLVARVYSTATEARISIRDRGPGLTLAVRGALGVHRVQSVDLQEGGAGKLGLAIAIARQAIVAMGGALSFSEYGPAGACIRVRLRAAREPSPQR